jgi:hypothetical protein
VNSPLFYKLATSTVNKLIKTNNGHIHAHNGYGFKTVAVAPQGRKTVTAHTSCRLRTVCGFRNDKLTAEPNRTVNRSVNRHGFITNECKNEIALNRNTKY